MSFCLARWRSICILLSAAKEKDKQKSDIGAITGARILADMESSCFKEVCCNVYLTEF
jgi:hypothetical protein